MKPHTRSVVGLSDYIGAFDAAKAAGRDTASVAAEMMAAKAVASPHKVKQANPEQRILQIMLSDGSVDRDRDSIDPRGWETRNFEANPVVLWAHRYSEIPIARDTGLEKQQMFLAGHPQFHEETELACVCYRLLVGGYLSTSSVGFIPMEWTWDEERRGYNILKQELVEYSIVPVPSNPNALVQARSAGIDCSPVKAWCEQALDGMGFQVIERSLLESAYLIAAGTKTISVPKFFVGENGPAIDMAQTIEIAGPDGSNVKTFTILAPEPTPAQEPKAAKAPTSAEPATLDKTLGAIVERLSAIEAAIAPKTPVVQPPAHAADGDGDGEGLTQDDVKGLAALLKSFRDESIAQIDTVFARAAGKVN